MKNKNSIIAVILVGLLLLLGGTLWYRNSMMQQEASSPEAQQTIPTLSVQAVQSTIFKVAKNHTVGSYFTDAKGMTLYTFTKDQPNQSNCQADCISTWPPYYAVNPPSTLPGKFGIITRPDGKQQYTWNKMPLYYFSGDQKPGDIRGEGYKNLWYVGK